MNCCLGIVPTRLNDFDFEVQTGPTRPQSVDHQSSLPQREFATACADDDFDSAWALHGCCFCSGGLRPSQMTAVILQLRGTQ